MENLAQAKFEIRDVHSEGLDVVHTTSEIFKPDAITDYEKRKAAEKAAIHSEIRRVTNPVEGIW